MPLLSGEFVVVAVLERVVPPPLVVVTADVLIELVVVTVGAGARGAFHTVGINCGCTDEGSTLGMTVPFKRFVGAGAKKRVLGLAVAVRLHAVVFVHCHSCSEPVPHHSAGSYARYVSCSVSSCETGDETYGNSDCIPIRCTSDPYSKRYSIAGRLLVGCCCFCTGS